MFGRKPNVRYLRVFGFWFWYKYSKRDSDKLHARAKEPIIVGYALGSRGYKFWDT